MLNQLLVRDVLYVHHPEQCFEHAYASMVHAMWSAKCKIGYITAQRRIFIGTSTSDGFH